MLPIFDDYNRTIEQILQTKVPLAKINPKQTAKQIQGNRRLQSYSQLDKMNIIKRSLTREQKGAKRQAAISDSGYYLIRCQSNHFYLREELRSYKLQEGDHVQVIGGYLAENDPNLLSYLWMFKYSEQNQCYQIVHARTDLSLKSDQFQCQIEFGSLSDCQAFELQLVKSDFMLKKSENKEKLQGKIQTFRIKDHNDNYLSLDGILQANDYLERDPSQEFTIIKKEPGQIPAFSGTGFIWTADRKLAIDLTNASRMKENDIILYEPNYRINQRWVFSQAPPQKEEGGIKSSLLGQKANSAELKIIYIRSALTEQFVTYNRENCKFVQSNYPQEWLLYVRNNKQGLFSIIHRTLFTFMDFSQSEQLILSKNPCQWHIPSWNSALKNINPKGDPIFVEPVKSI